MKDVRERHFIGVVWATATKFDLWGMALCFYDKRSGVGVRKDWEQYILAAFFFGYLRYFDHCKTKLMLNTFWKESFKLKTIGDFSAQVPSF